MTIALMALMLVGFSSCGHANIEAYKLKKEIEAANRSCPADMGMMGVMNSITYDQKANEVHFDFIVNEDIGEDLFSGNEAMLRKTLNLSLSKGESKKLVEHLVKAGASLLITYNGSTSGNKIEIKLTVEELKGIVNNPMTDEEINKSALEAEIAFVNSQCPSPMEDGVALVNVYDDGNNVVYVLQVDEKEIDISLLCSAKAELKQEMQGEIKDPSMKRVFEMLSSLGKGLVYRYKGATSGDYVDIEFSKEELESLI